MPRVIEINDVQQLAGHRLLWHKLLAETRNASFFQSLDWLEVYGRHLGPSSRLRVLVVRSAHETLGILPLIVETESSALGPVRVLTYPIDDHNSFFGPIGSQPTATLIAGLKYIQQTPRDWDLLDLRGVHRDGTDFGRTPNALRFNKFATNEEPWRQVPTVDLSQGWETYWESREQSWRDQVERSERSLQRQGAVELARYRPAGAAFGDDEPRWDLLDECERIASWSTQTDNYLHDLHETAVHAGALDVNLLSVNGRTAAMAYNVHFQGQVECLRIAYNATVADGDALTVLLTRMLSDSCRLGDHTVRFAQGVTQQLGAWLTSIEASYRYAHYPWTVARAQVLRLNRWIASRIERSA